MSEKIDIVRRLRLEANAMGEFSTYASREYSRLLLDSVDEIERLRAERDDARREICIHSTKEPYRQMCGNGILLPQDEANRRGWDCFKEVE